MQKLTAAILALVSLSSCATVFTGSKKWVTFDAAIEQRATVTVDGQQYRNVEFPLTVKVAGGYYPSLVVAESAGYEPAEVIVYKSFDAVSLVNILWPFGFIVDAATGAIMKPGFRYYMFDFEPVAAPLTAPLVTVPAAIEIAPAPALVPATAAVAPAAAEPAPALVPATAAVAPAAAEPAPAVTAPAATYDDSKPVLAPQNF
jgi:hypothetical protein